MPKHPSVQSSFFIRFLLVTAILGNFYLILQSACHTVNFHQLDYYLRWYGFNTAPWLNLILFVGVSMSFWGALQLYQKGIGSFKVYLVGKLLSCVAFLVLLMAEYKNSSMPFPFVLVPVLIAAESIYPVLIYISLRKSKASR